MSAPLARRLGEQPARSTRPPGGGSIATSRCCGMCRCTGPTRTRGPLIIGVFMLACINGIAICARALWAGTGGALTNSETLENGDPDAGITGLVLHRHDAVRWRALICGPHVPPSWAGEVFREFEFSFQFAHETKRGRTDGIDFVFGGLEHCGTYNQVDFTYSSGWLASIDPHNFTLGQIWSPPFNWAETVANKQLLCALAQQAGLNGQLVPLCYSLPAQLPQLATELATPTLNASRWFVKNAGLGVHAGAGIQVLSSQQLATRVAALQSGAAQQGGTAAAQLYVPPYLNKYKRKCEIRAYVAVTSTSPPRMYMYGDPWMPCAGSEYVEEVNEVTLHCSHMTHIEVPVKCPPPHLELNKRALPFKAWLDTEGWTEEEQAAAFAALLRQAAQVMLLGHPSVCDHHWNAALRKGGVPATAYMRLDFTIGANKDLYVIELNDMPWLAQPQPLVKNVQLHSLREYFTMLGLRAHQSRPTSPMKQSGFDRTLYGIGCGAL